MMEQNSQHSEDRPLRQLGQALQTDLESVRSQAMNYEQQLERFVQDRPVTAVLSALGVGFFVARMFSRR